MDSKKKSIMQQIIIIFFCLATAILLIISTRLYYKNEALKIEKQKIIDENALRLSVFQACDLVNEADFIDNIQINGTKICYDCNKMLGFNNGVIDSNRKTICTKQT